MKFGGPCPRHKGAICRHRHVCREECIEQAYEREAPAVDAELRRRAKEREKKKR